MADCNIEGCDGDHLLSYTCNECEDTFCTEHRLPEDHNCRELRMSSFDEDERFATGLQKKDETKRGLTKRETKTNSGSKSSKHTSQGPSDSSDTGTADDRSIAERQRRSAGFSDDSEDDVGVSSPGVAKDGSIQRDSGTGSTTSATSAHPSGIDRARAWAVGLITTASGAVSERVRRAIAWIWRVVTGIARLTGAALTILGIGWILIMAGPPLLAGNVQAAIPGYRPVVALLVGVLLVETTKE